MTKLEYEYAKGRLQGLRESLRVHHSTNLQMYPEYEAINTIEAIASELELQLQGVTVFDEVAELKARLEKAIVPKYQVGQRVWLFPSEFNKPVRLGINKIISYGDDDIYYELSYPYDDISNSENDIYLSKAEALKSLEER